MRGRDISNSGNFKARAGSGVCLAVSRVSDLAAGGIAVNQKNNENNNQEIRAVWQGFIKMVRDVAPETLEFERKEEQTPHSQFCLLELSLCVAPLWVKFVFFAMMTKKMAMAAMTAMAGCHT